jgi:hypothetical protein
MDMDQLRKINQLSSELKRHGMAGSSTDAYQQAEEIIQITQKPKPVEVGDGTVITAEPADPLIARQFQIELERVQKEHAAQLDVLRNAMNQIIAEVNSLRDDIGKLQSAQPPKPKEKQEALKTEPNDPHPRQGSYKPGDIDIKSVFYFGTKK